MEKITIYWIISVATLTLTRQECDDYGFNHDFYRFEMVRDTLKKDFPDTKESFRFYERLLRAKDSVDGSPRLRHPSGYGLSRSIDTIWVETSNSKSFKP